MNGGLETVMPAAVAGLTLVEMAAEAAAPLGDMGVPLTVFLP